MIPIVPEEILAKNPQFSTLFQNLTSKKLNPDASSRLSNEGAKEIQDVDKRLTSLREDLVKNKIIQQRLIHTLNELPADIMFDRISAIQLREVVDLYICAQSSGAVLRKDDEAFFQEGLPFICKSLNKVLLEDATDLVNMCDGKDVSISTLSSTVTARLANLRSRRQSLHQIRTSTLQTSHHLADLNRQLIAATIRLIEQTKHGITARAQKAQAKHLSLVSESLAGKVKIMQFEALEKMYDEDTVDALEFYKEHLEDVKTRIRARMKKAEGELEEYEGFETGETMKKEVARYAKLLDEIERTKKDIRRLGGDV